MIYRIRYCALEAGTVPRNLVVCVGLLLGSYVVSGVINASTVTQPALRAPKGQTVIVAPQVNPAVDDLFPAEIPEPAHEPGTAVDEPVGTHRL